MANPAIVVDFLANTRELSKGLRKASKDADTFGSKVKGMAKGLALGGGAALGTAVVAGATKAITAASDLNESINAVNVTFGDASKTILDFSNKAAKQAGLSMNEFNSLVVPVGASLENVGFSAQEAAKQSIALTKRAADMASVFNTTVPEAMEAIQSGLRGEADPLERFGIGLSDAAVKAEAMRKGLAASEKQLTANDKATARISLLMKQSNKFAGDFANTSDGLANRQRILRAQFENVAAKVGMKLLPAITDAVNYIVKNWPQIQRTIVDVWRRIEPTLEALGEAWVTIVGLIRKHWGSIEPVIMHVVGIVQDALKILTGAFKLVADLLKGDWSAAWEDLKNIVKAALDGVVRLLTLGPSIWLPLAKKLGQAILDGVTGALDDIGTKVRGLINSGITFGEEILSAMHDRAAKIGNRIASGIVNALTDIGNDVRGKINAGITFGEELLSALATRAATIGNRLISGVLGALGDIGEKVRGAINAGIAFGEEFLTAIYNKAVEIGGKIKSGVVAGAKGLAKLMSAVLLAPMNVVISLWNAIPDIRLPRVDIPDWVPKIGGKGFGGNVIDFFPDIPLLKLAQGGVVDRPTLAMVGEGSSREIVAPEPLLRQLLAESRPDVRVYIGDRELRDLVRVEVVDVNNRTAQTLLAGAV